MTVVTNPARASSDEDFNNGCDPGCDPDCDNAAGSHESNGAGVLEDTGVDFYEPSFDEIGDAIASTDLYDDEKRSDIVFVAGINGDTWRFPGHRTVLASASPIFKELLSVKTDVIIVDYVDRRGFEQLMRYQYCEATQLNSVATARLTLDTAFKFLCPYLVERCAKRLDEMLDARGVALEILRDLRYLCAQLPGAASAPPAGDIDDAIARPLSQCSRWCDSLAHNALLVIDQYADEALTDEGFEELSYEDLALIVRRPTLHVSSELVLAEALSRWATATCKQAKRELTPANRRAALGDLAYCPRYLLLAGEALDRALALELLEPIERSIVIARARRLSAPVPVGAAQEAQVRAWARPRPTQPAALPVHLSARTEPPEEPQPSRLCVRRPKRPKTPSFTPVDRNNSRGCCACFCDGLLRAFICLFD